MFSSALAKSSISSYLVNLSNINSMFQIRCFSSPITKVIEGDPIPLKRHRISRGRMFNPSCHQQIEFLQSCKDIIPSEPIEGPIEIDFKFFLKRPKSHYRSVKKKFVLKEEEVSNCLQIKKPDIDNLIKFVLDSLNGHLYKDDAQVCRIVSEKRYINDFYDEKPRTELKIKKL